MGMGHSAESELRRECEQLKQSRPWTEGGIHPKIKCDFEWMLLEECLPDAQWNYGKEPDHGWPYPTES
jgi:hypothetical protein